MYALVGGEQLDNYIKCPRLLTHLPIAAAFSLLKPSHKEGFCTRMMPISYSRKLNPMEINRPIDTVLEIGLAYNISEGLLST
jgi:hypothetical protein